MDNASTLEASEFLDDPVKGTRENKYHLEFGKAFRDEGQASKQGHCGQSWKQIGLFLRQLMKVGIWED